MVIMLYVERKYPGKVLAAQTHGAVALAMVENNGDRWRWPRSNNDQFYPWDDIVKIRVQAVACANKVKHLQFLVLDNIWGR